jgi:hypothetical protein
MDLYMKERAGKPNADCQIRSPMPSTSAEPSSSPWGQGQARPMGASEAGGGRRDRWGQARLVGAGEANGGRKPPGQIPSQHGIAVVMVKSYCRHQAEPRKSAGAESGRDIDTTGVCRSALALPTLVP